MLKIPEEQQKACYASGYFRRYTFEFDGFTIGNDKIHSESVIIKEAICEDAELKLGGCIASSCEFEVSETVTDNINLSGLRFKAYLHTYRANQEYNTADVDNPDWAIGEEVGNPIPMGVFNVRSVEMVDDADYKKVTAYDDLYDWNVDVSEWYNNTFPSSITSITYTDVNGNTADVSKGVPSGTTQKTTSDIVTFPAGIIRNALIKHLMSLNGSFDSSAYQQITSHSYMNDNVGITKTMQTSDSGSVMGVDLLRYFCELAGGFGRINRYGIFEIVSLGESGGLYPENNVFPEDSKGTDGNLYPEDNFVYLGGDTENGEAPDFISTHYEEYNAHGITSVGFCVRRLTEENGVKLVENGNARIISYPDNQGSNPYITSNPLVLDIDDNAVRQIARNIYDTLSSISYRPNTTTLQGVPYYEPGDYYNVTKKISFESFVLSRTLTGVQGLRDEFSAQGLEVRENTITVYDSNYTSMSEDYQDVQEIEEINNATIDNEENYESTTEYRTEDLIRTVTGASIEWDTNKWRIDEYGHGAPTLNTRKKTVRTFPGVLRGHLVMQVDHLPDINSIATSDFDYYYCDTSTGTVYEPVRMDMFNAGELVDKGFWKRLGQSTTTKEETYYDYDVSDVGRTYLDEDTGKLYRLTGWNLSSDNPQFRWDFIAQLEKVTTQLSTTISQTSERITLEANKLWSETSRLDARVDVEAGRVNSLVTKTWDLDGDIQTLSSNIEQLPHKISLTTTNGSKTSGITIQLTDEYGRVLDSDSANITLTGVVGFEDLSGAGRTVINGANIRTGTIDAQRINLATIASNTGEVITFKNTSGIVIGNRQYGTAIDYGEITCGGIKRNSFGLGGNLQISGETAGVSFFGTQFYFGNAPSYFNGDIYARRIRGDNNGAFDIASNGLYIYPSGTFYINGIPHGSTSDRFVRISSSGYLYYTTGSSTDSSRRYKYDIKPVENIDLNPHRILYIPVKQFKFNHLSEVPPEDQNKDVIGMVAEDVAEIYPVAAVYRDGKIENWNERYIIPPMLSLIQEMYQKINVLEAKIKELGGN